MHQFPFLIWPLMRFGYFFLKADPNYFLILTQSDNGHSIQWKLKDFYLHSRVSFLNSICDILLCLKPHNWWKKPALLHSLTKNYHASYCKSCIYTKPDVLRKKALNCTMTTMYVPCYVRHGAAQGAVITCPEKFHELVLNKITTLMKL